jgi:NAD-dependent SIR2 family protein deacetylase
MKTAILLGAGASASEGAPLQSNLFRDFFRGARPDPSKSDRMLSDLSSFFQLVFQIDTAAKDLDAVEFPTFEEAIGILDLAERRRESIRYFDLDNIQRRFSYLRVVRQYLVLLLAKVIHEKLQKRTVHHARLVQRLSDSGTLRDTVFISTNYDILIDNALVDLSPQYSLDYGVDFTNFGRRHDWKRPGSKAVRLYKIHGSLNWLHCPTCNTLTLTPKEKGVIRVLTEESTCPECDSVIVPIIVPPTFFKDMSNAFLSTIWHKAERSLSGISHLVVCGYSFPDADMHIKYLLKRIQTNRNGPMSFTVINQYPGKPSQEIESEKNRFRRFLGHDVHYTSTSFQEFADNPQVYL